jgi:hypothetical protein
MRVLLISPPFYRVIGFYNRYFPFGVAILGTLLKERGHTVLVYDADLTEHPTNIDYSQLPEKYPEYLRSFRDDQHPLWREARSVIAGFRPDLVGISAFTTFAASAFHIAALSKQVAPGCPVVLGGPHATVKAGEALAVCPDIDFAVRGEGEETLLELIVRGRRELLEPSAASPSGAGKVSNPPRERCAEVDRLPSRTGAALNEKYSSEDMGLIDQPGVPVQLRLLRHGYQAGRISLCGQRDRRDPGREGAVRDDPVHLQGRLVHGQQEARC